MRASLRPSGARVVVRHFCYVAQAMPSGFSAAGLPLSLQIVGRPFGEPTFLRISPSLEKMLALTANRPAKARGEPA